MLFKKHNIIVFAGDSVTDCGRVRPAGEGPFPTNPYGRGYAAFFAAYMHSCYPNLALRIINQGQDGDCSSALLARYNEIIRIKPNWMIIMIGINDVWRHFDCPYMREAHINCTAYMRNVEEIIIRNNQENIRTILLSPFIIEGNKSDPFRVMLGAYQDALAGLAEKYRLNYLDIQAGFDELLQSLTSYELSQDRIHPNATAHMKIMLMLAKYIERSNI